MGKSCMRFSVCVYIDPYGQSRKKGNAIERNVHSNNSNNHRSLTELAISFSDNAIYYEQKIELFGSSSSSAGWLTVDGTPESPIIPILSPLSTTTNRSSKRWTLFSSVWPVCPLDGWMVGWSKLDCPIASESPSISLRFHTGGLSTRIANSSPGGRAGELAQRCRWWVLSSSGNILVDWSLVGRSVCRWMVTSMPDWSHTGEMCFPGTERAWLEVHLACLRESCTGSLVNYSYWLWSPIQSPPPPPPSTTAENQSSYLKKVSHLLFSLPNFFKFNIWFHK